MGTLRRMTPDPIAVTLAALQMQMATLQQQVHAQDERLRALEGERRRAVPPPPLAIPAPAVTSEEQREREKAQILSALEETSWNRVEAAQRIGMPRRTFYRRLAEYGIQGKR
jgi:transcriptional regulator of acetoin/glycerol metabolism